MASNTPLGLDWSSIGTIVNIKVYDVICKLTIYMKLKTFKTKVKLKDADSLNKVQFSK